MRTLRTQLVSSKTVSKLRQLLVDKHVTWWHFLLDVVLAKTLKAFIRLKILQFMPVLHLIIIWVFGGVSVLSVTDEDTVCCGISSWNSRKQLLMMAGLNFVLENLKYVLVYFKNNKCILHPLKWFRIHCLTSCHSVFLLSWGLAVLPILDPQLLGSSDCLTSTSLVTMTTGVQHHSSESCQGCHPESRKLPITLCPGSH